MLEKISIVESRNFIREILKKPIKILDVGARGGLRAFWSGYIDDYGFKFLIKNNELIEAVAIESDERTISQLKDSGQYKEVIHAAIYSECKNMMIYLTADGGGRSSLLEPHIENLEKYRSKDSKDFKDGNPFKVIDKIPIETKTLSQVLPSDDYDWIKIDVQGVEYDILSKSEYLFSNAVCIMLEVQTAPLYKNQKLRDDVDQMLEKHGFERIYTFIKPQMPVEQDVVYFKRRSLISDEAKIQNLLCAHILNAPDYTTLKNLLNANKMLITTSLKKKLRIYFFCKVITKMFYLPLIRLDRHFFRSSVGKKIHAFYRKKIKKHPFS